MRYTQHFSTKQTHQSQPIPGAGQVPNSAGGYAWEVTSWTLLDRFLVLGTEGGSYYASEKDMTYNAGEGLLKCIAEDGLRVVSRIVEISEAGRAPKNDPAIFALAVCAGADDVATRRAACEALPRVCRIGTHLFQFCEAVEQFRGHGRALNRALQTWYLSKKADDLAYQMIKYQSRANWSHRDVLRLCKSKPDCPEKQELFAWVAEKPSMGKKPALLDAYLEMQNATCAKEAITVLKGCPNYPWEAIPTTLLGKAEVWEALLPNLPLTALTRNLGRMTASGALGLRNYSAVTSRFTEEAIKKARLHPISVLTALLTYKAGQGQRGNLSWNPVPQVIDCLDEAFYTAFGNVEPTGKRLMLAIDVSGSMDGGCVAGVLGLTPRIAAAAMALVTQRVETDCHVVAFSDHTAKNPIGNKKGQTGWSLGYVPMLEPLTISSRQRLDDVVEAMRRVRMGGTDCALPMLAAEAAGLEIDCFCLYTDSETWAGKIHPAQALQQYRQKTGIPAKLVVVGMVSNEFSIADPRDGGMIDVVGFDTATPNLIADFARGEIQGS